MSLSTMKISTPMNWTQNYKTASTVLVAARWRWPVWPLPRHSARQSNKLNATRVEANDKLRLENVALRQELLKRDFEQQITKLNAERQEIITKYKLTQQDEIKADGEIVRGAKTTKAIATSPPAPAAKH